VLRGGPGRNTLLPGSGSPPSTTYATKSRGFSLQIVVRHREVTAIHMRVVTDCSDGTKSVSWSNDSSLHIPIRHGRFVSAESSDLGGSEVERLTGRVGPDRTIGTYFESSEEEGSEHNRYICATGPVHDRGPIHYVALKR
jgi:hypothetical protein